MTELFDCCAAVTTAIRAGKTGEIEELMAQAGEVHDNRVFAKRAFYSIRYVFYEFHNYNNTGRYGSTSRITFARSAASVGSFQQRMEGW